MILLNGRFCNHDENMNLSLSLPETVLLHKKGPLLEGKKICEWLPLDPNEGHLTSNSCDLSSENNSSHLNDTGRQLSFPNFNSILASPVQYRG